MARPFLKDNAYTSIFRRIKTKEPLDPELRIRVTDMEVCTISVEKHFKNNKLCKLYGTVFLLLKTNL